MRPVHVVLLPDDTGNPTDKHLVVMVKEWVPVSLGEKDTYDFSVECEDLQEAFYERDRLNSTEKRTNETV